MQKVLSSPSFLAGVLPWAIVIAAYLMAVPALWR
jgi:hypothetical protein